LHVRLQIYLFALLSSTYGPQEKDMAVSKERTLTEEDRMEMAGEMMVGGEELLMTMDDASGNEAVEDRTMVGN